MGIQVNLFGSTQQYSMPAKKAQKYNSPFDKAHSSYKECSLKGSGDTPIISVPKDGIFQLGDILPLSDIVSARYLKPIPLSKYEGQPWTKEIFNETASYLLDNIRELKLNSSDDFGGGSHVAEIIDRACFKGKDLTPENKSKIIEAAKEYGWQLPKSFRKYLNNEQKKEFDNLANDFKAEGQEPFADEVKKITKDGGIKYEKE